MQLRGRGKGPVAPGEGPDGPIMGDTHSMAPGFVLLAFPPLDQKRLALRGASLGLRGGDPAAADGEGTEFREGRRQRGHPSGLRAHTPLEAGGPPERDCCTIRTA